MLRAAMPLSTTLREACSVHACQRERQRERERKRKEGRKGACPLGPAKEKVEKEREREREREIIGRALCAEGARAPFKP